MDELGDDCERVLGESAMTAIQKKTIELEVQPTIREIDMGTAHFAEAATFGGKPHHWIPSWLCRRLHKRHFYGCWSEAEEWKSHVHCGYCQVCRHLANGERRYLWLPNNNEWHTLRIICWPQGTAQIETNELYLPEIYLVIEALADEHKTRPVEKVDSDYAELQVVVQGRNGGSSYRWEVDTLNKSQHRQVLTWLLNIYAEILRGEYTLAAEKRWWHRLEQ